MKRFLSVLIAAMLVLSISIPSFAAEAVTTQVNASADKIVIGEELTLTVSTKNSFDIKSAAVDLIYDAEIFDLVSGKWLLGKSLMDNVDLKNHKGVIAFDKETNFTGNIFKFVLKAKKNNNPGEKANINAIISLNKGSFTADATSTNVKVICQSHKFNQWTVEKPATCEAEGTEKRICSDCGEAETRIIAPLGHKFGEWKIVKNSTCTTSGEEKRVCQNEGCKLFEKRVISAKGHDYDNWITVQEPTCTIKGRQERTCKTCKHLIYRYIKALGHDFEDPKVVKEATIYSEGLIQGKCKRCNNTTSQIIPCNFKDENNGIYLETSVGAFNEGTKIKIDKLVSGSAEYANVEKAFANGKFVAYNIAALLNGSAVEPSTEVEFSFNVLDDLGKEASIYFLNADGKFERLNSDLQVNEKEILFTSSKMGTFVMSAVEPVKIDASNSQPDNTEDKEINSNIATDDNVNENESSSNITLWIIIIVIALIIITGIIIFVVKRKKN